MSRKIHLRVSHQEWCGRHRVCFPGWRWSPRECSPVVESGLSQPSGHRLRGLRRELTPRLGESRKEPHGERGQCCHMRREWGVAGAEGASDTLPGDTAPHPSALSWEGARPELGTHPPLGLTPWAQCTHTGCGSQSCHVPGAAPIPARMFVMCKYVTVCDSSV